jgi:hypothetical protein
MAPRITITIRRRVTLAVVCMCWLAVLAPTHVLCGAAAAADETFEFSPLKLPRTVADLPAFCASAKQTDDAKAAKLGLVCYAGTGFKGADQARFYFLGDSLYQVELEYKPATVDALGGMGALLRKLVQAFGPADISDASRRSWRINSERRADFYFSRDPALLVLTETMLEQAVQDRR